MTRAQELDPAKEIFDVLKNWGKPSEVDKFEDLTGKSLDTVTHLTEYEDEKANRILTAMTFISAFAGILFAAVVGHYSTSYLQQLWRASHWRFIVLTSGYALFCLYALAVSAGVFWSLYGMKPRFNVPKEWKAGGSRPSSLLFFEKIIEVSPADWARAFTGTTPVTTAVDLTFEYAKNNILETYLIAQKIPTKLRSLRRANTLYIASACILVVWVVVTAIAIGSIDLWPNAGASAIESTVVDNEAPSVPPNVSHNAASAVGETRSAEQTAKGRTSTPIEQMLQILNEWQPKFPLDKFHELTTKSFDTVTRVTEYEDEKANRILTAIAFISAFAAVLFAVMVGRYSATYLRQLRAVSGWRFKLLISGHGIFAVYTLVVVAGALFSVLGLRPTFVLPKEWNAPGSDPSSYLFFLKIKDVRPTDWANAFKNKKSSEELMLEYIKNEITETHLISEGLSVKLAKLETANVFYVASLCVLFLWVLVTGIAICSIDVFPNDPVRAIDGNSARQSPPS
jgi:hypothetical protein